MRFSLLRSASLASFLALALTVSGCVQPVTAPASSKSLSEAAPSQAAPAAEASAQSIPVAGLKGPTSMGLVNLKTLEQNGQAQGSYELSAYGSADEIVPLLTKGEVPIAAIPANLAATLYNKTQGAIQVVDVNTLGVLYVVENGSSMAALTDLAGQTVLSMGRGTTPQYVFEYLLQENGLEAVEPGSITDPASQVAVDYRAEATEVTALMQQGVASLAVLPQPYVTAVTLQQEGFRSALSLTEEWAKVSSSQLVTGVTVVNTAWAKANPEKVAAFLADHAASTALANEDAAGTAVLCEEAGIVAKAAIAQKALPACNIVCVTGEECKTDLDAYLNVLFAADPASVGGTVPGGTFYWQENV